MRGVEGPRYSHLNPESEPEQRPPGSSRRDGDASIAVADRSGKAFCFANLGFSAAC